MYLYGVLVASLAGLEIADGMLELCGRLCEERCQLTSGLGNGRDAVEIGRIGNLIYVVEDVVKPGREGVDVLVVEGGDEGTIESAHNLVGEFVPLVLKALNFLLERCKIRYVGESLLKKIGGADKYCSLLLEEVVKASLAWDERQG